MEDEVRQRITRVRAQVQGIEERVAAVMEQLRELERIAARTAPAPTEPSPTPAAGATPAAAPPARPTTRPTARPRARRGGPALSEHLSSLGPARLLAIAGGIAVLAGLVFLYVLAAQSGVLGPAGRVLIGVAASLTLIGAGVAAERRGLQLTAAAAAIGVGIAGLYIAVTVAARRYELIADDLAILLAAAIAAGAVALATHYRSQWIAAFGLIGALIAPLMLDSGLTPALIVFVLVISAAILVLWLSHGWTRLAWVGGALSTLYALSMVAVAAFEHDPTAAWSEFWQAIVAVAAFWVLANLAWLGRLRMGRDDLVNLRFVVGAGTYAAAAARLAFEDLNAVYALVVVAVATLMLAPLARVARGARVRRVETATVLVAAAALALAFIELFDGGQLVVALAIQGVVLGALALREHSDTLELGGAAHAVAAGVLMLTGPARPDQLAEFPPLLLTEGARIDSGAAMAAMASAVAVAVAVGLLLIGRRRRVGDADPVLWAAGVLLGLYAVSTVIIDATLLVDFSRDSFQIAHVLVSVVWAAVALGALYFGLRRDLRPVRIAGLALLGITAAKLVFYDLSQLASIARVVSFIAVGLLLLAGSVVYQRLAAEITGGADDDGDEPEIG